MSLGTYPHLNQSFFKYVGTNAWKRTDTKKITKLLVGTFSDFGTSVCNLLYWYFVNIGTLKYLYQHEVL